MAASETVTVSTSEFKARCFELLNLVRDGKSVIVTKRGVPFAQLVPIVEKRAPFFNSLPVTILGDIVRRVDEKWDVEAWFAELDRYAGIPFMEDGRRQPPMPDLGADAL